MHCSAARATPACYRPGEGSRATRQRLDLRNPSGSDLGLGGDFDGIEVSVEGMDDVSTYPALFAELARRGYSQQDLEKIASRNLIRVFRATEAVAKAKSGESPSNQSFGS